MSLVMGFGFTAGVPLVAQEVPISPTAASLESGYASDLLDSFPGLPGEELVSGLRLGAGLTFFHDTNPGQAPGTSEDPEDGSAALTFAPTLSWLGENTRWRSELSAKAGYNEYLDGGQYSGGNYSFAGSTAYDGGRWDLVARFRHAYADGVNRYYAASVSQMSYGAGMEGSYELSPKTSLRVSWDSSWSVPDGGFGATENHVSSISALWRYSPRLRFGPGVALKSASGDIQERRDSVGPMMTVAYDLSRKISIQGTLGIDVTRYEYGGDDAFVSSRISAEYELNRLWSFNTSFIRSAEADGSLAGGFRETTGIRFGVNRKIRRVTAALGLGYEHSDYLGSDGESARDDVDYVTGDLSLSFPLWADHATGMVFLRNQQSGSDDLSRDWDAIQTGLSLSLTF